MKRNILLLFASSFVFISCTKNDAINTNPKVIQDNVLVSKTIETDASTGNITTSNYSYEGSKLISIVRTGAEVAKTLCTYSGDLITKMEDYDSNDQVLETRTYSYNNSKLVNCSWHDSNNIYTYKTDYTYISTENIKYANSRTKISTNITEAIGTGTINVLNGNFMSNESMYTPASYEYDSKKQPFKNINGLNFLMISDRSGNQNNVTKINFPATTATLAYNQTNNYIYNSNDYPTEIEIYYSNTNLPDGLDSTTQYFYQEN